MTSENTATIPFLVPGAKSKMDEVPEYEYSEEDDVNVIASTRKPLAEDNALLVGTQSKTNAEVETDDPDP